MMIDEMLARRLWLYANRANDNAYQLDPGRGVSAGPLLSLELIASGIRAALIGLALVSDEEVADLDKLPEATFPIARALEKAGVRQFTLNDLERMVRVDRIMSAGIERHLLDSEVCRSAYQDAAHLGQSLTEELRLALGSQSQARHG